MMERGESGDGFSVLDGRPVVGGGGRLGPHPGRDPRRPGRARAGS